MRAGGVPLLVAAFVLCGCGAKQESSRPADSLEPAPPVEAIDEPAANRFFGPPEFSKDGTPVRAEVCRFLAERAGQAGNTTSDCRPTKDDLAEFLRFEWEDRRELVPVDATELQSIARLVLKDRPENEQATLIVWHSETGKLCIDTDIDHAGGFEGGSAFGPCLIGSRCTELCLERSGHFDYETPPWLLSGIVTSKAEELRVVFADGHSTRYPLTGPLVPGAHDRRVFIADLGRRSHRRLELLVAGKVIAHRDEWPRQVATDQCVLTYKWPAQKKEFDECMVKAVAEPAND